MGKAPVIRVRLHRYTNGRPIGLIWQYGSRSGEVSSNTTNARTAERAAGRLEEQLEAGNIPTNHQAINVTWQEFRQRYETEWLGALSYGSQKGWKQAADHFEKSCSPNLLADVTKSMLSSFIGTLESKDLSTSSINSYYRALHAGLGWAESVDLIDKVPRIRRRKQGRKNSAMRSRPITLEEFERMLAVAPKAHPKLHAELQRFMLGLWHSGLRISELNLISWNKSDPLHVEMDGKIPLIVMLGQQKNNNDTYLPAPPAFWEMIDKPGVTRRGRIFAIKGRNGVLTTPVIGKTITKIGRLAGIVVNPNTGKCASSHDLRRSFLTKVAANPNVTQSQAQAIARHSDPKTTSQYYVRHEAETLADAMGW